MEWKVRDLDCMQIQEVQFSTTPRPTIETTQIPFNGHRDFRPRVHRPWSEVAQTPGDEVKNDWSYYSIPRTYLHGVDGDNFIFLPFLIFIVTPCMLSSYSIITPTTAHV